MLYPSLVGWGALQCCYWDLSGSEDLEQHVRSQNTAGNAIRIAG